MSDEIENQENKTEVTEKPIQAEREGTNNDRPDDFDKLSLKDATRKAIEVVRERESDTKEAEKPSESPTKTEVKQDLADDLEPPSTFNKEEKEAWRNKDIPSIMKAYRRLEGLRTQEVTRAQREAYTARQEAKQWLDLNPVAKPYVEARAKEGITFHQAIKEALEVVSALRSTKPAEIKEALRNAKIDLDSAEATDKKVDDSPLHDRISSLERIIENQEVGKLANAYDQVFKDLGSLKTRTGEAAFPEFNFRDGDEEGMRLASAIGSSVRDPGFQAGVRRRIPDADFKTLVLEAYKYNGGKVSGQPTDVSPEKNQKHVERARRAASSTPARQVSRNDRSNLVGKLSPKAALRQALIDYRER